MKTTIYDLLLRSFPAEFRQRHGEAMRRAYVDALVAARAGTPLDRLRTRLAWWADVVRQGLAERWTERGRGGRRTGWPQGVAFDARLAARRLVREPAFTAFVALTLALGIGGTAAVFAFYNAAFLRPLPWPAGERLVRLEMVDGQGRGRARVSLPDAVDLGSVAGVAAVGVVDYGAVAIAGGSGEPVVVRAAHVSPSLFDVLQTSAARGRLFTPEEGVPGSGAVAVLSDGLWRRRFGGDPGVIGAVLEVQGHPHEIVGILPRGFAVPDAALEGVPEVWLPLAVGGALAERGSRWLQGLARLEEGRDVASVTPALAAAGARLAAAHPETNEALSVRPLPLREAMWGDVRTPLRLILAAAAFVLLIACANLANLLLARSAMRASEMALRSALGAGRARTAQQLILEHGALALLGGAAGAGLVLLVRALGQRLAAGRLPMILEAPFDLRVVGVLVGLSVLAGVLFGTVPALHLRRPGGHLLREGRTSTRGRAARVAQRVLVAAQVALCFVLLSGAALLLRGFRDAVAVDPGFDAERILSWEVSLPTTRYADDAAVIAFAGTVLDHLAALPGVEASGLVDKLPLGSRYGCADLVVAGTPAPRDPTSAPCADLRAASADYLRAMGIRRLEGQPLDRSRPEGVLVNRTLAQRLWPGESALGRRIGLAANPAQGDAGWQVIGVVDDVLHLGPREAALPEIYLPFEAAPDRRASFVVRATGDPAALVPAVRRAVAEVDAALPLRGLRTMDEALLATLAVPRAGLLVIAALSIVALFLAVLGLYGVQSYLVARRAPEIGIRMALGAGRPAVVRLVLADGLKVVLLATLLGAGIAVAAARALRAFLFGADAGDPLTFAAVAALLLGISALACWVPARRAASIGPTEAMRTE